MKWLHLSDLHIVINANWTVFERDLYKLCKDKGSIDLVIVTGDFHNFTEADDFSKAKNFLEKLMKELNLNIKEDLFLIPGNHDGSCPICDHKDGNIAVLKENPMDLNKKEWDELLGQFKSFEQFVKELIPGYPCVHPAMVHSRIWKNKIRFIQCNSAVVSNSKEKKRQLIDINTFAQIAMESELPTIVLAHNNFEDIHEEQQKQIQGIIRNSKIKAYFCGDRHIQQVNMINSSPLQNCQIPCVGSFKGAPDSTDTYSSYGAIIGKWINEKATLEGWIWEVEKGFRPDNEISCQTIDMGIPYECNAEKEVRDLELVTQSMYDDRDADKCQECIGDNGEDLKKMFRILVFNLSDTQRYRVNLKFSSIIRAIENNESVESVDKLYNEIIEKNRIDEIINYIKKVYEV